MKCISISGHNIRLLSQERADSIDAQIEEVSKHVTISCSELLSQKI